MESSEDERLPRQRRAQAIRKSVRDLQYSEPLRNASPIPRLRAWRREHVVLATLFATATTLVAAIAPGFANATRQPGDALRMTQTLEIPLQLQAPGLDHSTDQGTDVHEQTDAVAPRWHTVTVQSGQTMGDIFASLGLSAGSLHRLLDHPGAREPLTRIRPGSEFHFSTGSGGELRAVRFDRDESTRITLEISQAGISEQVQHRELQHRIHMAGGQIEASLFGAGEKAGLSNGAIIELAKVFGYDIDFAQDLRVGDRFSVVYEEIYREGERLRAGDILAATFVNQGRLFTAFRHELSDGRVEYFDADGRPLKKSFLRIPIEFARISSRFSSARRHPILGRTRAHKGVDYAAGTGTPIMSAGEGRITFAGWKGGYGRTVIVDHGRGYTTLYGHMSRFGSAKTGARVRQGETIGYVGASGLATGPHLHYEFRINGVHRDPLKVTLPKPEPLPSSELARFRLHSQPLLAKLQMIDGGRAYASR